MRIAKNFLVGGAAVRSGFEFRNLPENVVTVEQASFDEADALKWFQKK